MTSIDDVRKGPGRPVVGATPVTVRVPPDQLTAIDAWISEHAPEIVSRPEALRRLAADGLTRMGYLSSEKQLGRK